MKENKIETKFIVFNSDTTYVDLKTNTWLFRIG